MVTKVEVIRINIPYGNDGPKPSVSVRVSTPLKIGFRASDQRSEEYVLFPGDSMVLEDR